MRERLERLQPDAIHIATEGPLGWAARRHSAAGVPRPGMNWVRMPAPTRITDSPSPPRNEPNSRPIVISNCSAIFECSSITPMKTNKGTATSTSLLMKPT